MVLSVLGWGNGASSANGLVLRTVGVLFIVWFNMCHCHTVVEDIKASSTGSFQCNYVLGHPMFPFGAVYSLVSQHCSGGLVGLDDRPNPIPLPVKASSSF